MKEFTGIMKVHTIFDKAAMIQITSVPEQKKNTETVIINFSKSEAFELITVLASYFNSVVTIMPECRP